MGEGKVGTLRVEMSWSAIEPPPATIEEIFGDAPLQVERVRPAGRPGGPAWDPHPADGLRHPVLGRPAPGLPGRVPQARAEHDGRLRRVLALPDRRGRALRAEREVLAHPPGAPSPPDPGLADLERAELERLLEAGAERRRLRQSAQRSRRGDPRGRPRREGDPRRDDRRARGRGQEDRLRLGLPQGAARVPALPGGVRRDRRPSVRRQHVLGQAGDLALAPGAPGRRRPEPADLGDRDRLGVRRHRPPPQQGTAGPGAPDRRGARVLHREAPSLNIANVDIYAWRDAQPGDPNQCAWCARSGLLRYDGRRPKPAWRVYTSFTGGR